MLKIIYSILSTVLNVARHMFAYWVFAVCFENQDTYSRVVNEPDGIIYHKVKLFIE